VRSTASYDGITYAPGTRFRVVREGLTLHGLTAEASAYRGWSQKLSPGDVLTCTGYGPGWGGDPGYGIEFTTSESIAAGAINCDVMPSVGGRYAFRPPAGSVEPEEKEE